MTSPNPDVRPQKVICNIYKAKMAKRPARPAPAMRAEFMSAAPVLWGLAGAPEAPEEPRALLDVVICGLWNHDLPGEAVGLAELWPAEALAALEAAAGTGPAPNTVWLLGKRL